MQATDTPPLFDHREAVGERLAAAPGLLLALDFDGTLAPIVEEPDDAAMDDAVAERLVEVTSAPTIEPAVVSGRQLADLRQRVGLGEVYYAGNHGLELRVNDERTVPEAARGWGETIDGVCDDLEARLADVTGCEIENKRLTATVHVRQVPADLRDGVEQVVRDVVADADEPLEVSDGKAIWEIRPPIDWDKGRALRELTGRVPADWLPIYVGDDVTDEDAFEALAAMDRPALAVLVGDREATAADYRLDSPDDVADFLSLVGNHHG